MKLNSNLGILLMAHPKSTYPGKGEGEGGSNQKCASILLKCVQDRGSNI